MILRLLFLTYILYVTPALCRMTAQDFEDNIDKICFKDKDNLIHGQENPLPNTLENFISLAEKFEISNPNVDFKEELFYFLRNYVYENIELSNSGISQWNPQSADVYEVNRMWEPDTSNLDQLTFQDAFTTDEKCSLYFMLSHSIFGKPGDTPVELRSIGNSSFASILRNNLNPDTMYPQEIGVVAIRGTDAAVALSKILYGMYVGLKPDRNVDILSYRNVQRRFGNIIQPDTRIDKLYAVTLSEVVALSSWSVSSRKGFAPNGKWTSITLDGYTDISDYCPLVYTQSSAQNIYSYSSVRGAADGLILGSVISDIIAKKPRTKLSQILRMYYSRNGVPVEGGAIEMTRFQTVSFCNRIDVVDTLETKLYEQTDLYYYMVVQTLGTKNNSFDNSIRQYTKYKRDIYEMSNTELHDYCSKVPTLEQPENLPREIFLDVIVVMDSVSEDAFRKQQKITGLLAKNLDLRYTGSRMTILLDQRNTTDTSASGRIELKPVVEDTYSSGCAACIVGQIAYERKEIEEEQVIQAIDQLLQEKKDNETSFTGVNGKVVLYFNFEEDDTNRRGNNKIQGRLDKVISDLHLHHPDVLLYAVGLNEVLLKRFAKNDRALVASAGIPEEEVVKKLFERIANAPGQLKYPDCSKDGRSENFAIYENYVSPNAVQHWTYPPEYFYKSINLKVSFESRNGVVKVCHNRATMKPELEEKNCNTTISGNRVEFKLPNPCKGFDQYSCSPFYFAVMGKPADTNGNNRIRTYCEDTKDHWCRSLDQIKFTVSHEGMRCSGCIGLRSLPAIVLFTLLISYILHKIY